MIIDVRLCPGASRDAVLGETDGRLRVAVRAPAAEGRANDALVKFLAKKYGVAKSDVEILSGRTGRNKRVLIGAG
ncbi:MAG: DUF167 domain-containing protein [Rickettsiales bacterium]|jgi:uncharacterized protein (TIGR00251 family)|nr:DUF167 domain-containing protein [Rickettsiales bacterium]